MSLAVDSYVTNTAHYLTEDWQLLAHVLQTGAVHESHTGEHCSPLANCSMGMWDSR